MVNIKNNIDFASFSAFFKRKPKAPSPAPLKSPGPRKWMMPLALVLGAALGAGLYFFLENPERQQKLAQQELEQKQLDKVLSIEKVRTQLSDKLGPAFLKNERPESVSLNLGAGEKTYKVAYTVDRDLQLEAEKLLKSYHPDYGALIVMNANTGAIKAMASFERNGGNSAENLALKGTYPAASIFKIITATAALDRYKLSPDTLVMYNGGNHTLYRHNVLYNNVNRWTREITLREAFARSINTVFGRLTLEKMQPKDIEDYAIRFGFNKPIRSDLPFDTGFTQVPQEKSFALAEIVSGYNKVTRMSPVQGAMIAASVANTGVMRVPYIVAGLKENDQDWAWRPEPVTAAVTMTGEGAERLKELMEATITQGTSRKSFRALIRDKKFAELELGGKTGSLHGDNPKGKVDWFVGYAIGSNEDKLAIGAITVNKEYWTVKSSYLAQSLFKKHFKDQFSNRNNEFFNAGNDSQ